MNSKVDGKILLPMAGAITAVISIALVSAGNPMNMGLCAACFLRDTAGALGLSGAGATSYARPEIIGMVFGAFLTSILTREFSVKGGSAPVTRFIIGMCLMVGALIFLGCPLRMTLRIAGGDLNAIVGLFGFAAGVLLGTFFLYKGFSPNRNYSLSKSDGFILPLLFLLLLAALFISPDILDFSVQGPAALHAPILISLAAGLLMGAVGFISRLCFVAGIRDWFLLKDFSMLLSFVSLIAVGVIGNLIVGNFNPGFENQPFAHTDGLWNFLSLALVGFCSALLGGCPFRQVILAGSGNSDSVITVFGMLFGAAIAGNFDMTSTAAGVTENGKIGFVFAAVIMLTIAVYNTYLTLKEKK